MAKPLQHLLVIRSSAMGDVAMVVPVLIAFCKANPQVKITILTRGFYAPFFEQFPQVSIKNFDVKGNHKGVTGLYKLYKELKTLKIDAVADLHNVLRSNILKSFFLFSGIPFQQIDKGRKEKKALTHWTKKIFEPLKTTHERYADVFRKIGFEITLTGKEKLQTTTLDRETSNLIGQNTKKWIGIAPFAQHKSKVYPLNQLLQVITDLNNKGDYKIYLFGGGKKETELLKNIEQKYSNCICVAGQLSLLQELQLISNLDAMISMDSGNGHMAAMYGIPVITIWGVTHPYAGFTPYGQPEKNSILPNLIKYDKIPTSVYGNKVPEDYENVMKTITPQQVIDCVLNALKASPSK